MDIDFNNLIPEIEYYNHCFCTPTWRITPLVIPFCDLTYVVKGQALYIIGDKTLTVRKGDLLCIPRGTFRQAKCMKDDLMECFAANFYLRTSKGADTVLPLPLLSHIGYIPELITPLKNIHKEWIGRDFGYTMKIRGYLLLVIQQILDLIINKKSAVYLDPRVKACIKYVLEHFAEEIDIHMMAEKYGLSAVYFGKLFQMNMGISFKRYLNSIRLNHAETLLRGGGFRVNEVTRMCGFSDAPYFSKVFKERTGVSPIEMMLK